MSVEKPSITTHKQVEALKPGAKDECYSFGNGLRLLLKKNGSKYWRLKYRLSQKQKTLALGVFPNVSLRAAKEATIKAEAQRLFDFVIDQYSLEDNVDTRLLRPFKVVTKPVKYREAFDIQNLPHFLKGLAAYKLMGRELTALAELLILTFVRSGELRAVPLRTTS